MKLSIVTAAVAAILVLAGCATPVVQDVHADVATRMYAISTGFDQARRAGGMAGVIMAIDQCYASTTHPVIQIYALRDCITLDYVGYRMDVNIGRRLFNQPLPYFTEAVFGSRVDHYAQMDGFTSAVQLAQYLRDTNAAVQLNLALINAAPQNGHHPIKQPPATHL